MVVEDEPDALETLQTWLRTQGCEVRIASSGSEALRIIARFQPEVLITDYLLQDDVNGVDLIAQLRATGLKARYILVTGMLQNALDEGVHRLHRVTILSKPFDFGRLRQLLS
jgi:two-component system, OmpR family, response regulator